MTEEFSSDDVKRLVLHEEIRAKARRVTRWLNWSFLFCLWNSCLMFLILFTRPHDQDLLTFTRYLSYIGWGYLTLCIGIAFYVYRRSLQGLYHADLEDLRIPTEWK